MLNMTEYNNTLIMVAPVGVDASYCYKHLKKFLPNASSIKRLVDGTIRFLLGEYLDELQFIKDEFGDDEDLREQSRRFWINRANEVAYDDMSRNEIISMFV